MPILLNIIVRSVIGGLICLIPSEGIIFNQAEVKGYRDIIFYHGKYLAVGTDGRIDYISSTGEKSAIVANSRNNLNCINGNGQVVVAAGNNGTILFSSDGKGFSPIKSGTESNINGISCRNGLFVAGADDGMILASNNGSSWSCIKTEARGNIVSVTANDSFFTGVTERGEILTSKDGFNWAIRDYNKEYSGYNKSCVFKKVLAANNRIVIIGRHGDNSPAVLFSSLGNVWAERSLVYDDDQGIMRLLTNEPNAITYDSVRDQFILACDKGEIFSLPSCTKCNKSVTVTTNDLHAIICTDDLLLSAGEDFYINILKL
jgi:hypothetical protein